MMNGRMGEWGMNVECGDVRRKWKGCIFVKASCYGSNKSMLCRRNDL